MKLKGPRWSMTKTKYNDVFKREFPVYQTINSNLRPKLMPPSSGVSPGAYKPLDYFHVIFGIRKCKLYIIKIILNIS